MAERMASWPNIDELNRNGTTFRESTQGRSKKDMKAMVTYIFSKKPYPKPTIY